MASWLVSPAERALREKLEARNPTVEMAAGSDALWGPFH